ncbi:aromatic-ring-hydroxylating dioxygenase subunit beta [Immundisolibacter sp.]|uniref:aromatic-ring-hydroxylating dioxygenase subunit beta n=1 Tax=Immundisolibacter sp. TaxID=1934948 RepID=UPI003568BFC6
MSAQAISRAEVEEFLAWDAWLLDTWQLETWLELFAPDARYQVPSTDRPDGGPVNSLYLIDDDYRQLCFRVKRFNLPQGHAEQPHSRTQRLVTNVLIHGEREGALDATAAFLIARTRHGERDQFVGRYELRLLRADGRIRFLQRKSVLAMPGLRPVGTVSIIV